MNIIYDEFGISPALKDIVAMLGAMRSRGCRMTMAVQDLNQLDHNYGKEVAGSIKNNVMNIIYLLGNAPSTLKEISERTGKKLIWNKERGSFDSEPVVTVDQLQKMSLGDALVLRQRRNPNLTRLYGYNRYTFFKNKKTGYTPELKQSRKVRTFDIYEATKQKLVQSMVTSLSPEKDNLNEFKKKEIRLEDLQKPL